MPVEQATQQIGFGPEALWITVGVLIAMAAIALMVLNLIKVWREVRKPKVDEQTRLRTDAERINDLEDISTKHEKEMTLLLRSQVAMLHHMADGNNTQALKDSQKAIEEYLLTGKIN
jgi:hypothetical protein